MMLALYSFVTWALQPFVRRKLKRRAALEPLYGEHIEERFGHYPAFAREANCPLIWIHAVSLGETRAAAILLPALRALIPDLQLLLTHGTATGRSDGAKLLRAGDIQVWQPWDTKSATDAFFAYFKPNMGILIETEIWPNLIAKAQAAHVPVTLVNARLSTGSLRQAHRWRWLARPAYQGLAAVYAQTTQDAQRLTSMGAKLEGVFGNLKFDAAPNTVQLEQAAVFRQSWTRPIILFASSREGEEALFLSALQALPDAKRHAVQWLIVPRHPQRFDAVANLIENAGFPVLRRSVTPRFDRLDSSSDACAIWLGDSLGEMSFYYGIANAALLGGSFEPLGGQNLIESLACGCPVIMGPHTFNFEEAAGLAAASSVAFRVDSFASAIPCALQKAHQKELGKQASAFVMTHRGAAQKTAIAIWRLLDS